MSYTIPHIELQLIEQCLDNDRAAQRQLFLKYKDAMYTLLYRMLNDEAAATDALQETFIAVFRSLKSFKLQSSLGAWIKTIAIRKGIDSHRHRQKLSLTTLEDAGHDPVVWPIGMTGEVLERAIAQLSAGYRTVFLLIEVEGYSHKEVADMLDISQGTSKSQLYHAKKALQKMLEGYQYG